MTDKSLDFRTTRKTMPVPCYENAYKSSRPIRSAKKSLPIDEIDPMDVYPMRKSNKSPEKKEMLQSENMRPKRNLDSSGYLTKKFLYQEDKNMKKRSMPESGRNFKKTKSHQDPMYMLENENIQEELEPEDWANNSSEGENIFESPKFSRYSDPSKQLTPNSNEKIYRILNPEFQQINNQEPSPTKLNNIKNVAPQPTTGEILEDDQVYHENEYIDESKIAYVDPNTGIYYDLNHRQIMMENIAKDKIDESTIKTSNKKKQDYEAELDEQALQDSNMNFYRKRNSSENSKSITTFNSPMDHQVDGSFINKNSYSTYSTNTPSNSNNGHMFVVGSNSRKRPTILKRNNTSGNSTAVSSSSNSNNSTSINSNPKVPPPMSRYPPPKFLTRQLVQMAAAAQRNPNNAAAVFSARKVLSSVPPQLAASVVNSVLAASQTTNSTPQVIQLATAVATSQQAAMISSTKTSNCNNYNSSIEEPLSPNSYSFTSASSKMSPTTVNSSQFSQPIVKQQVTASDKLFGKKITGKYLPPPNTNSISYPSPVISSQQCYNSKMNPFDSPHQNLQLSPQQDQNGVRVNVGGKKLLVVGGAVKRLLSNMQQNPSNNIQFRGSNNNQQSNLIIPLDNHQQQILQMHHDQDKIMDEETAKTFDEIQGYIPHGNEVDNMKDYETLEQNIVLDGEHIDMNEN